MNSWLDFNYEEMVSLGYLEWHYLKNIFTWICQCSGNPQIKEIKNAIISKNAITVVEQIKWEV